MNMMHVYSLFVLTWILKCFTLEVEGQFFDDLLGFINLLSGC